MTEIMPVPRNLILLSYQQGAFALLFFMWSKLLYSHILKSKIKNAPGTLIFQAR